uniref:SAC domain-containing protein n=1 Tax=Haemonchus placei TaxID=6290 RepID=A0A158QLD0_HAEPC
LGVVRFVEGYYLIIVTKANIIASFGYHSIYKIAEVAMISLAMDGLSTSTEEQRYVKLFQSVDLSTDFYFSYTYDLSRSLQENALSMEWDKDGERVLSSDKKFVWNTFLLEPLRSNLVSEQWLLEIVHGYVGQQLINLPFTKLSLTLIGRRSAEYAGTRFLKRGANQKGIPLNLTLKEVLRMTSKLNKFFGMSWEDFLHLFISICIFRWSQDPATRGVVGKPLILVDIHEPHAQTAAAHFRLVRAKYGNPVVVMNLVKRKEKRRHEGLLHDQFLKAINYLNQFLPPSEHIAYLSFDVARCNKTSTVYSNVLTKLEEIGLKAVQAHGWFQSFPMPYTRMRPSESEVVINCDALMVAQTSRSFSTHLFIIASYSGRVALACQLYAMGVVNYPSLSLQSDLCRAFEDLFDDHGDTMAWQYAGSQLVHSIKTYKKTAALQERSRDVIQTLSRYYSNTFGDYDKQAAINLFLGMFRPQISSNLPLWDLGTDYYLHFPTHFKVDADYCAWMYDKKDLDNVKKFIMKGSKEHLQDQEAKSEEVAGNVPNNRLLLSGCSGNAGNNSASLRICLRLYSSDDFRDFYRTFELTTLENRVKLIADARALSLYGINQEGSSSGQFMKLWKSEPKEKSKKSSRESDDEDDDTIEEEQTGDEVMESEPAWIRLVNGNNNDEKQLRHSKSCTEVDNICHAERPVLATGLQFAKELYGLGHLGPSPEMRNFYRNYVNSGCYKFDEEDWIKYKPTLLTDLNIPTAQAASDRRPTLFLVDDVFKVRAFVNAEFFILLLTKTCSDFCFFSNLVFDVSIIRTLVI